MFWRSHPTTIIYFGAPELNEKPRSTSNKLYWVNSSTVSEIEAILSNVFLLSILSGISISNSSSRANMTLTVAREVNPAL